MGCQQTTCAVEAIRHLESDCGHLVVPISELIKAACDRLNAVWIQRSIMRHSAVIQDDQIPRSKKEYVIEALDEAAIVLSRV